MLMASSTRPDKAMDAFYERLIVHAATIDELLSDDFEPLPGQKGDADRAARRLAGWCCSCASGDWSLFSRRLHRDRLSIDQVLARFATVRRSATAATPAWIDDAIWIMEALQTSGIDNKLVAPDHVEPCAFEHLFMALVDEAESLLWSGLNARVLDNFSEAAHACLRHSLLKRLSDLAAPAIYERLAQARKSKGISGDSAETGTLHYDRFVTDMRAGGLRNLFETKPVLLRLIASITRQWIDTMREFVSRLDADAAIIRREILHSGTRSRIAGVETDLSDPHNSGHTVHIVSFDDGSRVVYKPKDLRLDAVWYTLVTRLNWADPPVELKTVRAIPRDKYGWTEFIDHGGCADEEGCRRFFRRAGAWLALFHCFAGTDMHQENMIAVGDHPVPIDLEMILQATTEDYKARDPGEQAFEAAMETVANSVMMVGLLPAYGRSPDNDVFAVGGMTSDWNFKTKLVWNKINSDEMRPAKTKEVHDIIPNLPHVDGHYAKIGDHADDFALGFEQYVKFLMRLNSDVRYGDLFDGFGGLPVRKVIRPTRFYYMLLQRLTNHQRMNDGVTWSAQADFLARLADWERDSDPFWPLQRAERSALVQLNVPHFVLASDGNEICPEPGMSVRTQAIPGIDRARARISGLNELDIAWQIQIIRQNTSSLAKSGGQSATVAERKGTLRLEVPVATTKAIFAEEADKIAAEMSRHAIRRGPGAAWIGLDWLVDSDVCQLVCLGPELYNGVSGIAVFLAAHAAVMASESSEELALAAVSHLRTNMRSRNAARMARFLGIGGGNGLGSIVYALTVMSKCLHRNELLTDACVGAELFTDDLIAADTQLDVIGGSAGGILCLLRLYRDTQSVDVLKRAIRCGEHLLGQPRCGPEGRRSWVARGFSRRALNGMSHGAAGYAYALASLAAVTGRHEFANAALECIAFEASSFDVEHNNWPDLRGEREPMWSRQWCHGAPGIGLARIAMSKLGGMDAMLDAQALASDIKDALAGTERGWPGTVDTMCCGTLGIIEFFYEAGNALGRGELCELASRRLMAVLQTAASTGDYRWNAGDRQFNLGLFRGLAGVGYTLLRHIDGCLPNILIWE
jgi:type 2 lantibiotic biosynthesis protein LanM